MRNWYVGYFYYGYLKQLHVSFEKHSVDRFKEVKMWYPKITNIEVKDGKKNLVETPIFRDYILFEFEEDSLIWSDIIRFTPITKFLKSKNQPIPLEDFEVKRIKELEAKRFITDYSVLIGNKVSITKGPYKGMVGNCQAIIKGKYMARVCINMFDIAERLVEINLEDLELFE